MKKAQTQGGCKSAADKGFMNVVLNRLIREFEIILRSRMKWGRAEGHAEERQEVARAVQKHCKKDLRTVDS